MKFRTLLYLMVLFAISLCGFADHRLSFLSPQSRSSFVNLEELETLLTKRGFTPISHAYQKGDGIYIGAHGNFSSLNDFQRSHYSSSSDIVLLSGPRMDQSAGPTAIFMRFGEYAIMDSSLKSMVDKKMHKRCLFLSPLLGQYERMILLEYSFPYLAQIYLEREAIYGRRVLELGAGGGIASMFAILLGAQKVVAIEREGEAYTRFQREAKKNQLDSKLQTLRKDFSKVDLNSDFIKGEPFDVILANIGPHYGRSHQVAIELIKSSSMSPKVLYIGAGFSYSFEEQKEELKTIDYYLPSDEFNLLTKGNTVTLKNKVMFKSHDYPGRPNVFTFYQAFSLEIEMGEENSLAPSFYLNQLFYPLQELLRGA